MDIATKLQEVLASFQIKAALRSYTEIKNGNINRTYRINTSDDRSFIAQHVNTNVFRKPIEVMENIQAVTRHIQKRMPDSISLRFENTAEGRNYFFDQDHAFWRLFNYIESETYNTCSDPAVIRSAGEAFGSFQTALGDFNASSLHFTIPDFHNTEARYQAFLSALGSNPFGRAHEVRRETEILLSMRDQACTLERLYRKDELPLRVTHNDTKINNVLFDRSTHRAIAIIDLDTVMPGLVGHDFGDAIRFAGSCTVEDDPDTEKAVLNPTVFRAFTEGFLLKTRAFLTRNEIDTLALSCLTMTAEQAVRFLTDYINGDTYFKIDYPEHNLVRTRCQTALALDIAKQLDNMNSAVQECAEPRNCKRR